MQVPEGYLSVKDAARRAGMSERSFRARIDPRHPHPDPAPYVRYPNLGDRDSIRIPADKLDQWIQDHEAKP